MLPTHQAKICFAQVEAQINIRKITKYLYDTAAVDEDTATRVLDILTQPPATHRYATLKEKFVETFWPSDSQDLDVEELGNPKPSEHMDRMLALVPPLTCTLTPMEQPYFAMYPLENHDPLAWCWKVFDIVHGLSHLVFQTAFHPIVDLRSRRSCGMM
uniref:DUF7041 domain-containing protein n=1 Tax=Octopus bimaculoides TaxID=37653 RepID=A0A0L8GIG5_OCTBM